MAGDRMRFAALYRNLVESGYDPQSVVDAVLANDYGLLRHSGPVSVQLQPPDDDDYEAPPAAPEGSQ